MWYLWWGVCLGPECCPVLEGHHTARRVILQTHKQHQHNPTHTIKNQHTNRVRNQHRPFLSRLLPLGVLSVWACEGTVPVPGWRRCVVGGVVPACPPVHCPTMTHAHPTATTAARAATLHNHKTEMGLASNREGTLRGNREETARGIIDNNRVMR